MKRVDPLKKKYGNKYLNFASTYKNKEVLKFVHRNYTEIWNEIKKLIGKIDDKSGEYEKDYMKVKFNPEDNLPLNKILKLHNLTIVLRSVFQEDGK